MKQIHLFLVVCLFCALVSFTFITDYQDVLQSKKDMFFTKFQNSFLFDKNEVKRMKIVVWLNPTLPKRQMIGRRSWVTENMINPQNSENLCFKEKYRCEITLENDEDTLRKADAIIFIEFAHYFNMKHLPPNWHNWRRPEQIWAIQIRESGAYHPKTILEVFNWTISFRRDSDIFIPYGEAVAKTIPNLNDEIMVGSNNNISLTNLIKEKSKLVTGAISNCRTKSKRELIVKEMIKTNKSVDIYGGCGNVRNVKQKCGFYSGPCTDYWSNLAKTYHFYLAFENSLCVDYITEKFWRTLQLGMVPVVYGGADYERAAPPGSYIDLRWFKSAEELMEYLERVAENEEEYRRFFESKRYFEVREDKYLTKENNTLCEFGRKLRALKNGEIKFKTIPRDWTSRMEGSDGTPCTKYNKLLKWNL